MWQIAKRLSGPRELAPLDRLHHKYQSVMAMSHPELDPWKSRAQELEARVHHLEAENKALRHQIANIASRAVRSDGHGRESGALDLSLEPIAENTYVSNEGHSHQNPQDQPHSPPWQITFHLEVPQSQTSQQTLKEDSLLAAAPKTENDWLERRKKLQLFDQRSVTHTFLQFTNYTESLTTISANIRDESSGTEALLQTYRNFVQHLCRSRDRIQQLTNFGTLLYICLCRVARSTDKLPVETVNELMNDFLPRKKGSDYLGRLRRSVLWPVRQAEALRPWLGNRADEFFLLCKAFIKVLPSFAS
ncbi:hypothetical protein QBC44DRAFT_393542 [Cladorrhinum sp. PSN332]|nr:hypothetical protein QBC44DRAFT_393542 [Cladorrhinum sp. PSN332]